jgi:hypothetical protein
MNAVTIPIARDLGWRQLLARVTLAVCLVMAQYGANLHELSHAVQPVGQHDDSSLPHDELCVKCLAYAHVGHSMTSTLALFVPASYFFELPESEIEHGRLVLLNPAYQSRAPPQLS